MNIQVFGFRDDQDTRKALRFFSERRIPLHFVDLAERAASPGELRRFAERFGAAALVDRESPGYRQRNRLTIGHAPEEWRAWVESEKQRHASSAPRGGPSCRTR